MKKVIISIVMAVLMALALALTGCGETPSVFEGNYKTASKEEVTAFAEEAEKSVGRELDFSQGVSVSGSMKSSMNGSELMNLEFSYKMKGTAEKIEFAGTIKSQGSTAMDANVYYKDGYMYINGSTSGVTVKNKKAISIEEMMSQFGGGLAESYGSLAVILENYGGIEELPEGVKISFDLGKDAKKVKVEITVSEEGTTSETVIYMVYDTNYNITALKVDSKNSFDMYGMKSDSEMSIVVEPYDGKIELPSDLDTYEEVPTEPEEEYDYEDPDWEPPVYTGDDENDVPTVEDENGNKHGDFDVIDEEI